MKNFYVYVLFRPWNGEPCYIGKGHGDRIDRHIRRAKNHPNPHLRSVLKKAGGDLPRVILHSGLDEATAFAYERVLVKAIGRKANGGPLVNQTDGGDGPAGYRHTDETKAVLSVKGRRKHTPETIAKMIASRTGLKRSEEAKANMRAAQKGKTVSPECRARISATLKGRPNPKAVERLRQANKGNKHTLGRKLSPEHRAKLAEAWRRRREADEQSQSQAQG